MLNHLREHTVQRMFVKSLLDDLLCLKGDLARVAADIDAFKSLNGRCRINHYRYQDVLRNPASKVGGKKVQACTCQEPV